MGVENNTYTIPDLTTSNTFYEWYTKTNDEIIEKLNLLKVYSGLSGDGVDVSINPAGGVHTFSITPSITKGISFNGPVSFNNNVLFNSSTDLTTITVNLPLNTGVTSGNVVRISTTGGGLTFAQANSQTNAEVLGVVSHHVGANTVVKLSGIVDNTLFNGTVSNMLKISGGTLAPGNVYFLDSTTSGGITVNDQTTYGTVSKPMILGITGNQGCILPYRGVVNIGATLGITGDFSDKIIVELDYGAQFLSDGETCIQHVDHMYDPTEHPLETKLNVGHALFLVSGHDYIYRDNWPVMDLKPHASFLGALNGADYTWLYAVENGPDYFGEVGTIKNNMKSFYGFVSKILSEDWANKKIIVEITKPGGSYTTTVSKLRETTGFHPQTNYDNSSIEEGGDYFWAQVASNNAGEWFKYNRNCWSINSGGADDLDQYSTENIVGLTITPHNDGYGTVDIYVHPTIRNMIKIFIDDYSNAENYGNCVPSAVSVVPINYSPYVDTEGGNLTSVLTKNLLGAGITGTSEYDNLIINGGFDVWQRGYASAGITGLSNKCTPIADRWFKIDRDYTASGLTHGKSITNYTITRENFTTNQTEVLGAPSYYLSLTHQYSGTTGYNKPRLENVTYNPYQLQGEEVTLSFYAKGLSGSTLACYYTQYQNLNDFKTKETITYINDEITLNSLWTRYNYAFTISPPGFTASSATTGLFGIGFEFESSPYAADIANVRLDLGENYGFNVPVDVNEEVERCSPYYFKTYPHNITPGSINTETHHELTLGNLQTVKNYIVKYPIKTVVTPNSVTLFSNITGDINEAYNVSAGNDMKMTGGSSSVCPWSSALKAYRVAKLNAPTITVPSYNNTQMTVSIQNGAFSLDTLQFHYVIDSDVFMTNT